MVSIWDVIETTLDADGRGGADLIVRGFREREEPPVGTYATRGGYGEDKDLRPRPIRRDR